MSKELSCLIIKPNFPLEPNLAIKKKRSVSHLVPNPIYFVIIFVGLLQRNLEVCKLLLETVQLHSNRLPPYFSIL